MKLTTAHTFPVSIALSITAIDEQKPHKSNDECKYAKHGRELERGAPNSRVHELACERCTENACIPTVSLSDGENETPTSLSTEKCQ